MSFSVINTSLENLTGAANAIDLNPGATAIPDTTKPASPQFTYTIQAGDIISNANVTDDAAIFSFYGQNINGGITEPIHFRYTLNGTDVGAADGVLNPTVAKPYWMANTSLAVNALSVGDVLGIKMWVNNANQVTYIGGVIYVVPRTYNLPQSSDLNCQYNATLDTGAGITGSLGGVTYNDSTAIASLTGLKVLDSGVSATPITAAIPTLVPPQVFALQTGYVDNFFSGGNIYTNPTLFGISALPKYFRRQYLS